MDPICYGNTPYIVSLGLEKDTEWKLILDSHYIDEWNKVLVQLFVSRVVIYVRGSDTV